MYISFDFFCFFFFRVMASSSSTGSPWELAFDATFVVAPFTPRKKFYDKPTDEWDTSIAVPRVVREALGGGRKRIVKARVLHLYNCDAPGNLCIGIVTSDDEKKLGAVCLDGRFSLEPGWLKIPQSHSGYMDKCEGWVFDCLESGAPLGDVLGVRCKYDIEKTEADHWLSRHATTGTHPCPVSARVTMRFWVVEDRRSFPPSSPPPPRSTIDPSVAHRPKPDTGHGSSSSSSSSTPSWRPPGPSPLGNAYPRYMTTSPQPPIRR